MASHNDRGKEAEAWAAIYFKESGYVILHQNWRYRHWEVDIIAYKGKMLHFIEVKFRSSNAFGYPEESVDAKKIRHLIDASAEYLYKNPQWQRIQFDILSITLNKERKPEYFLIEDIYL